MINNTKTSGVKRLVFTFVEYVMAFVAYMSSVKSYNKPTRKIVFTNNGETEAAGKD